MRAMFDHQICTDLMRHFRCAAGCSALCSVVAALFITRFLLAGCSALPTLLDTGAGGRALPELLEAAEDMTRFMAT